MDWSRTLTYALLCWGAVWFGRWTVLPGTDLAVLAPAPAVAALWFHTDLARPRRLALDVLLQVAGSLVVLHLSHVHLHRAAILMLSNVILACLYAWALRRWLPCGGDLTSPRAVSRLLAVCWAGALPAAGLLLALLHSLSDSSPQHLILVAGSFTARFATAAFMVFAVAVGVLGRRTGDDLRTDAANRALVPVLVVLGLLELAMHGTLGFPALLLLLGVQVIVASWFSPTFTLWAVVVTCLVLLAQDRTAVGPFADEDPTVQAAYTQFYFGVLSAVVLLQSAFRRQRDDLMADVSRTAARAERQLQLSVESERLYHMAFQRAPVGALVVGLADDSFCRILRTNAEAAAILGMDDSRALLGQSLLAWTADDQQDLVADRVREEPVDAPAEDELDVRFHDATGREIIVRLVTTRISPAVQEDSYVLVLMEDVTARRLSQERLEHQALTDTLTQLPNRRLFSDRLTQAMAASDRQADPVGVLYLDLDGFKTVNDTHGHAAGDELLRRMAARLHDAVRPGDTVARLGGDEFALLCPSISRDGLRLVAERIVAGVGRPVEVTDGLTVTVGASVGAAQSRPHQEAPELVAAADAAMYDAKRSGRGCVRFAGEPGTPTPVPAQRTAGMAYR